MTRTVENTTYVGNGKKPMEAAKDFSTLDIASDLVNNLQTVMTVCGSRPESIALQNVNPGIMIEERFKPLDSNDDCGVMEFKIHTIWGRTWLVYWRAGVDGVNGFFNRDGSHVYWEGKNDSLPDRIDWDRIISIAERLGEHKDMFRTDIFVGVSSDRPATPLYVVSETEIHPTPIRGTERVFNEGGRLWLAGYKIGNYETIPDTEIPAKFLQSGMMGATK